MVGITFTPNLHLSLLPSNYRVWTQQMNDNLGLIDAAISAFVSFNNLRGVWQNSTQYAIGDTVSDGLTAVLYTSSEAHLSPVIPTTFEDERLAHPNRWAVTGRAASNRGPWTPATSYLVNDFVLADGAKYAMCLIAHTSSGTFAADLALGRWAVMIDLSAVGSLVLPVLSGPPDANKYTGTNAAGTNYINFDGVEAMARLSGVLNVARGGTGVQDFTGTGTKFVKQTDPVFFNTITVAATADALVVSEALNNSSTGVNAGIQSVMNVGGRLVQRIINYVGQYLQENSVGVTTRYSDFDSHLWRSNGGLSTGTLVAGMLRIFGVSGVKNLAIGHDDTNASIIPTNAGSFLFLGANNTASILISDTGIFPLATKTEGLGNASNIWGGVHTMVGAFYGATSGSITVNAPAVAGANTITWPAASGTVALVNAGATANFVAPQSAAQVLLGGAGVFSLQATTGVIGAAGQVWLISGRLCIEQTAAGQHYYTLHLWNGSAAVDTMIPGINTPNQQHPMMMQAIVTLTGPTQFWLRAAGDGNAGNAINSQSIISAIRLA